MFRAAKVEETITIAKAEQMLMNDLQFPKERAHYVAKQFDTNSDGKLSGKELEKFRCSVKHSKKDLADAFMSIDRHNVGYVSVEDAKTFLMKPPFNFPQAKVDCLLSRFVRDGEKINYAEFVSFYSEAKASSELITAQFHRLDADQSGALSPDELLNAIMQSTGLKKQDALHFIDQFDIDGNGLIDKKEFTSMWSLMFG